MKSASLAEYPRAVADDVEIVEAVNGNSQAELQSLVWICRRMG
jgi:hypothetical protein